jgi:putative CocE/NonD family hydrolase
MSVRTEFPRRVRVVDHTWIPMSDGKRLAARIWLPEDAEENPVPALLEVIPYRKNDGTTVTDSLRHPYFAGHGYASVRVDTRGSGDSEGVLLDEYLKQEQDDALDALAWLASQPWCTGATGMFGLSWGGFATLQTAARRPPSLKAVIPVGATHDRYLSDVHYIGGCVLADESFSWASSTLAYNARPPDPKVVGEKWREMWFERMEGSPPFSEAWLEHQRRDAFWKHGSVSEDYGAIECPVFAVSGLMDSYREYVPRLLEGLSVPRLGLIGPWPHSFPEEAPTLPIGFLQEAVRWWDHWLKGIDTGVMDEPMLRVWMPETGSHTAEARGRWIAEEAWPSPRVSAVGWTLSDEQLVAEASPSRDATRSIRARQGVGVDGGSWISQGSAGDQAAEDGRSLTFDSEPLAEELEVLGYPRLSLELSSDRPIALAAARICEVSPEGSSLLVARGILNLCHRDGHERLTPLEPDSRYRVAIELDFTSHTFQAGSRLRIAVSPAYWPWVWPSPERVTLTIATGAACRLDLPVRASQADDRAPTFAEAETAEPVEVEFVPVPREAYVARNVSTGTYERTELSGHMTGITTFPDGLVYETSNVDRYFINDDDPLSAVIVCDRTCRLERDAWSTRVETHSRLSANTESFFVLNTLEAFENGAPVFAKSWTRAIPRDHV